MGCKNKVIALAASVVFFLSSGADVSVFKTHVKALELTGTSSSTEIIGEGNIEGFVSTKVMKVVLPAVDVDFIVDPEGLIKSTRGAAYSNASFNYKINGSIKNDGFVFFKKTKGKKTYYSSTADLYFKNKSSYPVKVGISAVFSSGNSGVSLADPSNYNSTPQISFMLKDDIVGPVSIASASNAFERTLKGIPECYYVSYSSSGYKYDLNTSKLSGKLLPTYNVKLIGQCNPDADWSETDMSTSNLKIIWNITSADNAQITASSIKELNVSVNSKKVVDVVLTLEYSGGNSVSSVSYLSSGIENVLSSSEYSISGNKLTISSNTLKTLKVGSYTYKVTFSNGFSDTVQIDVE